MLLGVICLVIFLFTVFQLSKDDYIFIRKGVVLETIFNTIFLGLPIALVCSRLFYVFLHPNIRYINPLIFFIVPYFPGLSVIGGVIGAWVFVALYTRKKKLPTQRLLDILSISFLISLSSWLCIEGGLLVFVNRLTGVEEIGRGMLGIACFIFVLIQFFKSTWSEGSIAYAIFCMYAVLSLFAVGFAFLGHTPFSLFSTGITIVFLILSVGLYVYQRGFFRNVRRQRK